MAVQWTNSVPGLLRLDRDSPVPLRSQLEQALRSSIQAGRLQSGDLLPPSRRMAAELGVSRGLVVDCYAQLAAEGYLASRVGSATRVAIDARPVPTAPYPMASAPSLQAPSLQVPSLQAPSLRAPSLQAPSLQVPSLQAPSLRAPSLQAPSLQIEFLTCPAFPAATGCGPRARRAAQHPRMTSPTVTRVAAPCCGTSLLHTSGGCGGRWPSPGRWSSAPGSLKGSH